MGDLSAPAWQWDESTWRGLLRRVRAGRRLKPARWPGGARCAVALSFDCDHETHEMGLGGQNMGRLANLEFGRRAGLPRIVGVLARYGVPATFFEPAVCALIDPDEPLRLRDAGHEVGLHGWIHENNTLLSRDVERELMLRARDTLECILGAAPVGFRSASWDLSAHTIDLVRELGLRYDSSMMADDECYELLVEGKPSGVVEIPVDWVRDDAVYLLFHKAQAARPYVSPDEVLRIFIREFDAAYDEGGLCQLVMHPFVTGYRSRLFILDEFIRHAHARGHVWFATHAELATYVWHERESTASALGDKPHHVG